MAYGAVVSVNQILDQLLNTDRYGVHYPKPEIEYLYSNVCSLQSSLDKLSPSPISKRREVEELESQIRDVMYRAQDIIELFISSQIRSPDSDNSASLLVEEIRADLDSITETAEETCGNMISGETSNLLLENTLPSDSNFRFVEKSYPVGLDEDLIKLLDMLTNFRSSSQVIGITGSPGIGKTTLAKSIYSHVLIKEHFDICSWTTVSQDYSIGRIFSDLLNSIGRGNYMAKNYVSLQNYLFKILCGRRYLIVMDDVWDISLWKRIRSCLPDNNNGSRIVITSRDEKVTATFSSIHHVMRPLDEENSWRLLCQRSFGDDHFPLYLESIGRSIAGKCQGIPLLIVVIAGLLSRLPQTENDWQSIEADIHGAAAFGDESYLKILYLSYNNLPARLIPCFFYMVAFQAESEILVSKLLHLWIAEGFLAHPSSPHQTLEEIAKQHLDDLIQRSIFSVRKMSSDGQPKTCSLQANMWQIAMQESQKESFFHAIRKYTQEELPQGTNTPRRISIYNNILLCSEDVYNCTKSIEYARTLVYAGPDLYHPLPHCLTFELLRVLDALSVYFIELPDALFELVHLRYLAFTYDEDIPQSISKLQNLLILIIRQHPNIMFKRISNLPDEIWNMPQIRHLLFTECFLPDPCVAQTSVFFENLQSLSNVNVACCTREILQNMPNLKKLCTWIEGPGVVVQFDLYQLKHLETFKFTVMKPIPGSKVEFQPKLSFPKTVRKLSLSGCGLPWEDMKVIAELPDLQVLKLREFAFHGQVWCPDSNMFHRLRYLLLESLDLENLDADNSHFPVLERLIIKHCYQLKEINSEIGSSLRLVLIQLVDCSPNVVASVEHIKEEREELYGDELDFQVRIYSSLK